MLPFWETCNSLLWKNIIRENLPQLCSLQGDLWVWGVRKLLPDHYDQWEQPWAMAASKVYFFFLHIHTVRLQYYTLTYIKYRMFLKLLQRGANVWQFISEIFFFPASSPKSFQTSSCKGHVRNLLPSLNNFLHVRREYIATRGKNWCFFIDAKLKGMMSSFYVWW